MLSTAAALYIADDLENTSGCDAVVVERESLIHYVVAPF